MPTRIALLLLALVATSAMAQSYDPLILDLDGDGIDLGGVVSTSLLSGSDATLRWTTLGAEDCFVGVDASGLRDLTDYELLSAAGDPLDGVVLLCGGLQLRDASLEVTQASDAVHLLELFDDNGDGRLDASDALWGHLQLFMDYDSNGRVSSPELHRPETVLLTWGSLNFGPPTNDPWGNQRRACSWYQGSTEVAGAHVRLQELSVTTRGASWGRVKSSFEGAPRD